MPRLLRAVAATILVFLAGASAWFAPASARQLQGRISLATRSIADLRAWDRELEARRRAGELRLRQRRNDTLLPGRTHERLDQYYGGVRVFSGDVARQLQGGQLVSAFGQLYDDIAIDTTAVIDADTAATVVRRRGAEPMGGRRPELVVLPLEAGNYVLAWRLRAGIGTDLRQYFVDARTGGVVHDYSDRKTQAAVGRGVGVLGDSKKISVTASAGRFVATDGLRPPAITTYDLRGDFRRALDIAYGLSSATFNDMAADTDNAWTDGATTDAHVYSGWTYDYYFKRFGRRGLDNADIAILNIVHPARRQDYATNYDIVPEFYTNAGYYGDGLMVYGVGLPPGVTAAPQVVDFFSGALDVVAHELTHGVTEFSSNLIYLNESGALNEAFSDIMGTSVEFFFQQPGPGVLQADYLEGEDIYRPGGFRSLADPGLRGDPDHYSKRFLGEDDNGGVHSNSGIANHAFYLAIEGGTNRTSGLTVQGVGAANREQIEKIFYRAFTQMLPAAATFATARATTIQAARDLYGANSPAERAIIQAWTAVGVN